MTRSPLIKTCADHAPLWKRSLHHSLEHLLGIKWINRNYDQLQRNKEFFKDCLEHFEVDYNVNTQNQLPERGSCLVLSNHPFGAIEGIFLGDWLQSQRKDVKILANGLLSTIPELKDIIIEVDPFGGQEKANIKGMLEAIRWLKKGHVLLTFPSGEVSSFSIKHKRISDPLWSAHCAKLARRSQSPILPLFVEGKNSLTFQTLGLIHPRLRTLRLAWELKNKRSKHFYIHGGNIIYPKAFNKFTSDDGLRDFLRDQCDALDPKKKKCFAPQKKRQSSSIIEETAQELLIRDLQQLASDNLIFERQNIRVYACAATTIPNVLREIGRLREIAFRASGEGSGKSIDLDSFDQHYLHLFSWDTLEQRLIGAYRIGRCDDILDNIGAKGLYSQSLFRLAQPELEQLRSGLELGRSFVRQEYQKSPNGLPLLWKGILTYVSKHPQYRTLYGCVSICSQYQKESIDLMTDFCRRFHSKDDHHLDISPVKPYRRSSKEKTWLSALARTEIGPSDLSDWVSQLEPDNKGIPVLLRHYLRLGAQIISFNIDPAFGNVVDGLVVVDLSKANQTLLAKFMGKEALGLYLKRTKPHLVS